MALTYGFYSSLNGDRKYNAEQMSTIFNGVIRDGIFKEVDSTEYMMVKATSTASASVNILKGRAWFNGTWTRNDSWYTLTLGTTGVWPGADPVHARYDVIVLKVDKRPAGRMNSFEVITGTPAASPVPPVINPPEDVSLGIYRHPLAYIRVNSGATVITQSVITNAIGWAADVNDPVESVLTIAGVKVPGSPFVKSLLEVYEFQDMVAQWRDQFYEWMINNDADQEAWELESHDQFEDWRDDEEAAFGTWSAGEKSEFDTWFDGLQVILDDDVAANLANQIERIKGVHSATFTANNWIKSGNIYTQTANCVGMEENYRPIMVKTLSYGATVTDARNYNKAYNILINGTGETGDGTVTLKVYNKPDIDITVGFKGI